MTNSKLITRLGTIVAAILFATPAYAQLDRVYPKGSAVVSGTITTVTRDGVVIQVGGAERSFAGDTIQRVLFNREPSPLTDARSSILEEQYDAALAKLRGIDIAGIARGEIKADAMFYTAFCQGKLALAGQGDKSEAVKNMLNFTSTFQQSWHFYDAAQMLGDLALALGNYDRGVQYYAAIGGAKSAEYQLRSRYLVGWANLRQKKYQEASTAFGDVQGANVTSPEQLRLKKLAAAGQAAVSAGSGKADQGLQDLEKLINESDPSDTQLFGRLYNAQGACYAAKSDPEGAVLAYLKTHLLFPSDPDTHADALSELVHLWPQIGHPERGNEARTILEKRYPGRQ